VLFEAEENYELRPPQFDDQGVLYRERLSGMVWRVVEITAASNTTAPVTNLRRSEGIGYDRAPGKSEIHWQQAPRNIAPLVFGTLLSVSLGFVVGIVPGFLSGLVGWHKEMALVLPLAWAIGYILQRANRFRHVSVITYLIAILGGIGFGLSVWVFGSIIS
jgi:hypothetical protein